ncbi:MAG: MFS transporter, partial [Bacteroidales bacterium]|nr:MFS transporter [Bacteroidales bacterium]
MTTETKSLKTSKIACWLALACLVVPMFGSYFFDDMFSTVSQIFKNPEMLQLGWNSQQFGF